jgi:Domain of unknown function (DUF4124)
MTPVQYRDFKWIPLLAAGLALLCAGLAHGASDSGQGVVYRWVDSAGVVHYGDRIPPRYAQKATTILNDDGVVIGQLSAAMTASQLAQAAHEKQQRLEQKQRDTFLLTTYTSVADIEQLRDQRIAQIEGQRGAAAQYVSNLHSQLLALQARAMLYKPYNPAADAQRLPDDLAEQLVHTLDQLRIERLTIDQKAQQEATIRAQFQSDITRYRELTSAQAGSQ